MNKLDLHTHRIERLLTAVDHISRGDKTDFGRKLGYRDGAFVRQMAAGSRPITEKTVAKIESLHGMAGWFSVGQALGASKLASSVRIFEQWPFKAINEAKVRSLTDNELASLESAVVVAAGHLGLDIKNHN